MQQFSHFRIYHQLEPIVTNDWHEYKKDMKNAKNTGAAPKYVFFYDGECLCIQGDRLVSWLKDVKGLEVKPTKQSVSKQLHYHGLLKVVGGEFISHINIPEKPKGDYYHIYLSRLKEIDQNLQRKKYGKVSRDYYGLEWAGDHRGSEFYGSWNITDPESDYDEPDEYICESPSVDFYDFYKNPKKKKKKKRLEDLSS